MSVEIPQVDFGIHIGPGFQRIRPLIVYPEVTRTTSQASTRFLPLIPWGFPGFRGENLPETYEKKTVKAV